MTRAHRHARTSARAHTHAWARARADTRMPRTRARVPELGGAPKGMGGGGPARESSLAGPPPGPLLARGGRGSHALARARCGGAPETYTRRLCVRGRRRTPSRERVLAGPWTHTRCLAAAGAETHTRRLCGRGRGAAGKKVSLPRTAVAAGGGEAFSFANGGCGKAKRSLSARRRRRGGRSVPSRALRWRRGSVGAIFSAHGGGRREEAIGRGVARPRARGFRRGPGKTLAAPFCPRPASNALTRARVLAGPWKHTRGAFAAAGAVRRGRSVVYRARRWRQGGNAFSFANGSCGGRKRSLSARRRRRRGGSVP